MDLAYILHHRRFTDSRVILELWTENAGRVSGLIRTGQKKAAAPFMLFSLYEAEWMGRSDLKTLTTFEPCASSDGLLRGLGALCGLYLNELLIRCIPPGDPHQAVFSLYRSALSDLQLVLDQQRAEPVLRRFELQLLNQLGFGVDFFHCYASGDPVVDSQNYLLVVDSGFVKTASDHDPKRGIFRGSELLAAGRQEFSSVQSRRAAKWMTRQMLNPLLGDRPLKSRELFARAPTST